MGYVRFRSLLFLSTFQLLSDFFFSATNKGKLLFGKRHQFFARERIILCSSSVSGPFEASGASAPRDRARASVVPRIVLFSLPFKSSRGTVPPSDLSSSASSESLS